MKFYLQSSFDYHHEVTQKWQKRKSE
uniref:Uncharacterized protein n=1 Tax=Tetranychus urticae TaxID=32264 RepID=T1JU93_TETUR